MNNNKNDVKLLIIGIIIINIIEIGIIGIFLSNFMYALYIGLIIGTTMAILQILHIQISIKKALNKSPLQAQRVMMTNYFLRNVIGIIVIIIGFNINKMVVLGIILGLFSLKLSVYMTPLLQKLSN